MFDVRSHFEEIKAMPKRSGFKPGETAPHSGQSREIGPRGGKGREGTVIKGERLPPTT
jgi:hypothetical protein